MKNVLKLFFCLNFLFIFSIFSTNLNCNIYEFLNELKENNETDKEINDAINLLKIIRNSFDNRICDLEITSQFFNIYNNLAEKNTSKNLNALVTKISQFNNWLDNYSNLHELVSSEVLCIIHIKDFNNFVISLLRNKNLFSKWEKFLDSLFYKPWNKILQNKKIGISIGIAATIASYFLLNSYLKKNRKKGYLFKKEEEPPYSIKYFDSLEQPNGRDCGYYAARLALIMLSTDDQEILIKRLKKWGIWEEWLPIWQMYLDDYPSSKGWLSGEQIEKLFSEDAFNFLNIAEDDTKVNFKGISFKNINVIDDVERAFKKQGIQAFIPNIYALRDKGISQVIILNTAQMNNKPPYNGSHWITMQIKKGEQDDYSVFVADSLGRDRSDDPNVEKITSLFIEQIVPEEAMLEVENAVEAAFNIIEHNNDFKGALGYFDTAVKVSNFGDDRGAFWSRESFQDIEENLNKLFEKIKANLRKLDTTDSYIIRKSSKLDDYIEYLCGFKHDYQSNATGRTFEDHFTTLYGADR